MSVSNSKRRAKRQRARENAVIARGLIILFYREKSGYRVKKDRRDRDEKK